MVSMGVVAVFIGRFQKGSSYPEKDSTYHAVVLRFLNRSDETLQNLYGKETAAMTSPQLAARLVLAYLDYRREGSQWYRHAAKVTNGWGKLIVYSCHTGFLAHVGRAVMVAEELRNLGARVVFLVDRGTDAAEHGALTQRKYASFIHEAGFEMVHAATIDERIVMEHAQRIASWGFYTSVEIVRETEEQVEALKTIAQKERKSPDMIVTDFSPIMTISGERLGIPVASMLNFTWTNNSSRKLTPPETHRITNLLHTVHMGWVADFFSQTIRATNLFYAAYLALWSIPYNLVRHKYGLSLVRNFYAQMEGNLVLMPDFASFHGMKIDSSHLPVGPIVWEPKEDLLQRLGGDHFKGQVEKFINADNGKPLIYLTMGSSGKFELFKMVIRALRDKPYRILITTGMQFSDSLLDEICSDVIDARANILIIPLYPGGRICANADVEINHGGSGSIYQALTHGVAQLVIPTHADQQWNGDMLYEEGIGQMLLTRNLTEAQIVKAVEALLNGYSGCVDDSSPAPLY